MAPTWARAEGERLGTCPRQLGTQLDEGEPRRRRGWRRTTTRRRRRWPPRQMAYVGLHHRLTCPLDPAVAPCRSPAGAHEAVCPSASISGKPGEQAASCFCRRQVSRPIRDKRPLTTGLPASDATRDRTRRHRRQRHGVRPEPSALQQASATNPYLGTTTRSAREEVGYRAFGKITRRSRRCRCPSVRERGQRGHRWRLRRTKRHPRLRCRPNRRTANCVGLHGMHAQ